MSNHGCCDVYRRKTRLSHVQAEPDREIRMQQGDLHAPQVCQDNCGAHHDIKDERSPQIVLIHMKS